jgi:DNA polymerase-3 subunit gamma/tau
LAEVLYRKWRPRSFGDLAGQDPVSRTLRNAVAQDRVAHAYLLCGPRGTGKTSTGRILAKAINCEKPVDGEPCDNCVSCKSFADNAALDLIEIDAASNRGIDEIRALRDTAAFHPVGKAKVYLIDEVHMLTEPAFNALLKILEEPPPHVVFILATTEAQRVPATILSRCQRFNFRRISVDSTIDRLRQIGAAEGISVDQPGLELLARSATGSLRDAINLLEQAVAYHGRDLSIDHVRDALGLSGDTRVAEVARAALQRDLPGGLGTIATVRDEGVDLRQFTRELVQYLRALMLVQAGAEVDLPVSAEALADMKASLANVATDDVVRALRAFGSADFRAEPLSSLPLELALADCALAKERDQAHAVQVAAARAAMPERPAQRPAPTPQRERPRSGPNDGPGPSRGPQGQPPRSAPPAARPALRPVPPSGEERPAFAPQERTLAPVARTAPPPPPMEDDNAPPAVKQARERWMELFNLTRTMDKRAGAFLNSPCDIVALDEAGGRMTIGFRFPFHAEKLAKGDGGANLDVLTRAVQQVYGKAYKVECTHDPNVIDRRRMMGGTRPSLVREALELGARIVGEN